MASPIVRYTVFRDIGIGDDSKFHSYVIKDERMFRPIVRDESLGGLAKRLFESNRLPGDDFTSPEVNHGYRVGEKWYQSKAIGPIELREFIEAYAGFFS